MFAKNEQLCRVLLYSDIKCQRNGTEEKEMHMAVTRKFLKALGIEDEKIDEIIEAHTEVTEALKKERDSYKADAEEVGELRKKVKDAEDKNGEDWKAKYEEEHKAYESYKTAQADKELAKAKETAYTNLLKEAKVSEKRIKSILKVTDLSAVKLDKDGVIKDADKLSEAIKTEWADFITSTETKGADTKNPPDNKGGKMSREDIMKIKDPVKRQKAIAENFEAFGYGE